MENGSFPDVFHIKTDAKHHRNCLRRRRARMQDLYEEYSKAADATDDAAQLSPGFL